MVFLHGGVVCPAEIAALLAAFPFAVACYHWLRCHASRLIDRQRCQYDDCEHPLAAEDEQITCNLCRDDLGLDPAKE